MKYDPKTHLLRPLEDGEIIEEGDVRINFATCRIQETHLWITKAVFTTAIYTPHFRPVPITPGWRPRSEANEAFDGLTGDNIVAVSCSDTSRIDTIRVVQAIHNSNWHAFYIIPTCDLTPPDPERERFERWWKLCAPENMNATDDKETAYCIWLAARKEAV